MNTTAALHVLRIDFEKAFDKVSHKNCGRCWQTLVLQDTSSLSYNHRTRFKNQTLEYTRNANKRMVLGHARGKTGLFLVPLPSNLMAELLMRMALERRDGYEGGFRIGGRCITNP